MDLLILFCLVVGWISLGINVILVARLKQISESSQFLDHLIWLGRSPKLSRFQECCLHHLRTISENRNEIFQQLIEQRILKVESELGRLASGRIEFSSTEKWRDIYESILRSPEVVVYRSVSYIESPHYWQDGSGEKSTQLNLDLQGESKVSIERTAIIADSLWPKSQKFPVAPIHKWLERQNRCGIYLQILRESDIAHEPDLKADFGIYGKSAVGTQFADAAGRTIRFILDFDFKRVKEAEQNWMRLEAYSTPYVFVLDRNK